MMWAMKIIFVIVLSLGMSSLSFAESGESPVQAKVVAFKDVGAYKIVGVARPAERESKPVATPSANPPDPFPRSLLTILRIDEDGAEVLAEIRLILRVEGADAQGEVLDIGVTEDGIGVLVAYRERTVNFIYVDRKRYGKEADEANEADESAKAREDAEERIGAGSIWQHSKQSKEIVGLIVHPIMRVTKRENYPAESIVKVEGQSFNVIVRVKREEAVFEVANLKIEEPTQQPKEAMLSDEDYSR